MTQISRVTFWLNRPSIHQAPLIQALAALDIPVRLVTEWPSSPERTSQGWPDPVLDKIEAFIAPDQKTRQLLERSVERDELSIFSGIGAYPLTTTSLTRVTPSSCRIVFSEPWDPRGARGLLRRIMYRGRLRRHRHSIDAVLATGPLAVKQFVDAGYPRTRVYPFGYFVETSSHQRCHQSSGRVRPRLIMVAQLIKRKGIVEFIESFAAIDASADLDLYGGGPLEADLRRMVDELALGDRVSIHGPVPYAAVRLAIAEADALFLNSLFDGWGAVVNEALVSGTPAYVSSQCGAASLITRDTFGCIYSSTDPASTHAALIDAIALPVAADRRQSIRAWAETAISPEAAANYLVDIFGHLHTPHSSRPGPPWED